MSNECTYFGSKISLISKAGIRYEGILYNIDSKESTVALSKVKSFGTEDRPTEKPVLPRDEIYEFIVFRGSDVLDIHVCETPKQEQHQLLNQDPAIVTISQNIPENPTNANEQHSTGNLNSPHPSSSSQLSNAAAKSHINPTPLLSPSELHHAASNNKTDHGNGPSMTGRSNDRNFIRGSHSNQSRGGGYGHNRYPLQAVPEFSSDDPAGDANYYQRDYRGMKPNLSANGSRRGRGIYYPHYSDNTSRPHNPSWKTYNDDQQHYGGAGGGYYDNQARRMYGRGDNNLRGAKPTRGVISSSNFRGKPQGRSGAQQYKDDYDFDAANATIAQELAELSIKNKDDNGTIENASHDENEISPSSDNAEQSGNTADSNPTQFYDKNRSFFDTISSESVDRAQGIRANSLNRQEERRVNVETFGMVNNYGFRGGPRGAHRRGGYHMNNSGGPLRRGGAGSGGRGYSSAEVPVYGGGWHRGRQY